MFIARPAAEIEPHERIFSSSRILPGPMLRSVSRSIRMHRDGNDRDEDFRMFGSAMLVVPQPRDTSSFRLTAATPKRLAQLNEIPLSSKKRALGLHHVEGLTRNLNPYFPNMFFAAV